MIRQLYYFEMIPLINLDPSCHFVFLSLFTLVPSPNPLPFFQMRRLKNGNCQVHKVSMAAMMLCVHQHLVWWFFFLDLKSLLPISLTIVLVNEVWDAAVKRPCTALRCSLPSSPDAGTVDRKGGRAGSLLTHCRPVVSRTSSRHLKRKEYTFVKPLRFGSYLLLYESLNNSD